MKLLRIATILLTAAVLALGLTQTSRVEDKTADNIIQAQAEAVVPIPVEPVIEPTVERGTAPVTVPSPVVEYTVEGWEEQCYAWAAEAGVPLNDAGIELIRRESHCNPNSQNPTSTAYGIGQFLDSTWASYDCVKNADPINQLQCMWKYVQARYGDYETALQHSYDYNWY